nr:hypothetical protein [candidate division Zixibacteria bacterium]
MKAPAVDRKILVLLAGLVWSLVGIGLMIAAISWLIPAGYGSILAFSIGVVAGIPINRLGFSKLAKRNIVRIFQQAPGKDKICLFAFQNIRSYFIVLIMMVMGYALRHLPIPKIYLSPLYLTIGWGLFLASLKYYARIWV